MAILIFLLYPLLLLAAAMESVDKFCRERSKCVHKDECKFFFGDSLSKYRKMPTGQEKKRTLSKLRSLVCNKAENGVCCDEPTLIATLQVELFFNVLVVVSLRPENRGSRRAITRDGRPAPRGTLPAGKGGFPALPRTVGRGGFPAP